MNVQVSRFARGLLKNAARLIYALPLVATAIAIAGSVTYEYDELGRLKSVTESNGRQTVYVPTRPQSRVAHHHE